MRDPFPIAPPEQLTKYITPVADYLSLQTLPLHIHEVLLAFTLYTSVFTWVAPAISRFFIPQKYATFNARTRLNWNVHIVSFTQSTLICVLALWVISKDEERSDMNWSGRVHGYTGASGLIQAFAGGYFLWDFAITIQHISVFGPGMLAHAVSALFVFSLGFRPFVNFYGPTFILYELSSPFLNIHWFCDKLSMTGSKIQLYNGILLLCTFFGCRLVWGSYQSVRVFYDVYRCLTAGDFALHDPAFGKLSNGTIVDASQIPTADIMRFAGDRSVPLWLAVCYLASNLTLNGLNWFWFGKMIETIRKRFDPPLGTRRPDEQTEKKMTKVPEGEQVLVEGIHVETPPPSMPTTPFAHATGTDEDDYIGTVKLEKSNTHLEAEQLEVRRRVGGKDGRPMSSARAA